MDVVLAPTAQESEKAEGFVPLFNGKDLTGWRSYDSKPNIWVVADGMLVCKGTGGGWLGTDRIGLQNHTDRVEFRNLRVKELK